MKKIKFRIITNIRLALLLIFCFGFSQIIISQPSIKNESVLKKKQEEFSKWKYGMFLHFNMGTFVDKEWATGYEIL